jgi:hypothetical protein
MTNRTGQTVSTPGTSLDVEDFVQHQGVWYRLVTVEDSTRYSRRFLGVAKDGSRRRLLLDNSMVKAYRWHR